MSLGAAFLAALPRTDSDDPEALDEVLTRAIAAAHARWPSVRLSAHDFVVYLAARIGAGEAPSEQLASRHLEDLYLAFGCSIGDAAAIAAFDQAVLRDLPRALRRGDLDQAHLDDTRQQVATKLLARTTTAPPAIAQYAGRGSLRGWVRVIAIRESGRLLQGQAHERPAGDDALFDAVAHGIAPSQSLLKETYRQSFKRAFEASLAALSIHDRLLLRQHFLDGLGIDRLAAVHDVHRATAARWIAKLVERLLADTRARLETSLGIQNEELDSVLRLIQSCLDASIGRALR
ncbi:MAG: transcriptional regulator [Myxococcota bacterium]|nr:transcriptional regulator [Deltaproteobacteria bacterium]MDQ3336069.1 transcriptional regulator [Myxococcota bacterium]